MTQAFKNQLIEISSLYAKLSDSFKVLASLEVESTAKATAIAKAEPPLEVQPELPHLGEEEPKVTLEEVRGVLAQKSRDGFTKEVKELLSSFGVSRLSALDSKAYAEVLEKAKEIGHAR